MDPTYSMNVTKHIKVLFWIFIALLLIFTGVLIYVVVRLLRVDKRIHEANKKLEELDLGETIASARETLKERLDDFGETFADIRETLKERVNWKDRVDQYCATPVGSRSELCK